jgi:hypothetical protein
VNIGDLLQQIESRRKIEKKLPSWYTKENIYYPPRLNLEQTSSELAARYKTKLVAARRMADITGGFGVDSYYFSQLVDAVDHFELDTELSEIAAHNLRVLGRTNISFYNEDGLKGIQGKKYDLIYADPSRRSDAKGKVFFLEDCMPDIPAMLPLLFGSSDTLLIKTSPMLDILAGLRALVHVAEVHIVAIHNEVKELLWVLKNGFEGEIEIRTINMNEDATEEFAFTFDATSEVNYSLPMEYLYEPNAAIMKSGAFSIIGERYGIFKLHANTHLYTHGNLREFPGRRFRVLEKFPYSKKGMRDGITFDKANIATRNFPASVSALRKKWKLKDGGDRYIFFTTSGVNEKMVLLCEKIKT